MSHNHTLTTYEVSLIYNLLKSRMESVDKLIEIFKNYNDEKAPEHFKLYSEEKQKIELLIARLIAELNDKS